MMYKAFAGLTLVAAPIIVFVAQNLVPQRPAETATAVQAAPAKPMPLTPPLPPATAPEPVSDAAAFGQPMPDAAKPFFEPGSGLPGGEAAPAPEGNREGDLAPVPAISD